MEIISPFKSLNLLYWNSIVEYCVLFVHSGLLWIIQFWIQTECSFGFNFKIWGSETERLVLINILRDSLDIQGIVN